MDAVNAYAIKETVNGETSYIAVGGYTRWQVVKKFLFFILHVRKSQTGFSAERYVSPVSTKKG